MVTTIVPTHLVKRIGTGTIDQSEDPCPPRFAARRPTEERSRRICRQTNMGLLSAAKLICAMHMAMAFPYLYYFGTWIL